MSIRLEARHLPALQKLFDAVTKACCDNSFQLARAAVEDSGRDLEDLASLDAIAEAAVEVICLHEGIPTDD